MKLLLLFILLNTSSLFAGSLNCQQKEAQLIAEFLTHIKGPKTSIDKFIKELITLMRKFTPGNKLNTIFIGQSGSLQKTTISKDEILPRILIKSPYSELVFTFNTDIAEKSYDSVEIIYWNALEAKFKFILIERKDHLYNIDISGQKCIACHSSQLRPIWESYRAWSGVLPSRDDMLEFDPEANALTPDSLAYLKVLKQIESKKIKRLNLLDIPIDYIEQFKKNDKVSVDNLKTHVEIKEFYRVPHYPYKKHNPELSNLDVKTALLAGPSQMLFDQFMHQNLCRVEKQITSSPLNLAPLLKSVSNCFDPNNVEDFLKRWINSQLEEIILKAHTQSQTNVMDAYIDLYKKINSANRSSNHKKVLKQQSLIRQLLTSENSLNNALIEQLSFFYSNHFTTPNIPEFHAIEDPGGVRGVKEANTEKLALIWLLLLPTTEDVRLWSMANRSFEETSFSFSDQLQLLLDQYSTSDQSCDDIWEEFQNFRYR